MSKAEQLITEYEKRFGTDAPGANIYYDSRIGWMWNYLAPQLIGANFDEAMNTVKTSRAMEFLLEGMEAIR